MHTACNPVSRLAAGRIACELGMLPCPNPVSDAVGQLAVLNPSQLDHTDASCCGGTIDHFALGTFSFPGDSVRISLRSWMVCPVSPLHSEQSVAGMYKHLHRQLRH